MITNTEIAQQLSPETNNPLLKAVLERLTSAETALAFYADAATMETRNWLGDGILRNGMRFQGDKGRLAREHFAKLIGTEK